MVALEAGVGILKEAAIPRLLINVPCCPTVNGWMRSREVALKGRNRAIRAHVTLVQQQEHLMLSKFGVAETKRHQLKVQVPKGEPGIFPAIRDRQYVVRDKMPPLLKGLYLLL